MRTTKIIAGTALLASLALAGCGSAGNTTTPASQVPAPAAAATKAPAPTTAAAAAFGDSVKFPNGVSAVVTAKTVPAGQYASGAVEGKITVVTIVLTNGGDKPFQAGLTSYPTVTYGAAGDKAGTAADMSIAGQGTIGNLLPGETQTAVTSWGIPSAGLSAVRVELSAPDLMGTPAVFKGAVQ